MHWGLHSFCQAATKTGSWTDAKGLILGGQASETCKALMPCAKLSLLIYSRVNHFLKVNSLLCMQNAVQNWGTARAEAQAFGDVACTQVHSAAPPGPHYAFSRDPVCRTVTSCVICLSRKPPGLLFFLLRLHLWCVVVTPVIKVHTPH